MFINQASEAGTPQAPGWHEVYRRAVREPNDLVGEVRTAVEYGLHDPVGSVEMIGAAEETTGAVVTALSSPWSLYTPQDAATAAAGLFIQLEHQAEALQELGRAVGRIAGRGETVLPAPAAPGQPANLADALATLQRVSEQVHSLIAENASATVSALEAAPASAALGADVHTTVAAVAVLLAEQHPGTVTLNRHADDAAFEDIDDSDGWCGCSITLHSAEDEYTFYRGDCEWSVLRESDRRDLGDGHVVYDARETLPILLQNAHPQQLTNSILRIVADDQQEPDFAGGLRSIPTGQP
ncbi:hypothetical protein [Streptomyces rubiginosohelvolus]|uniref:hypothetical protein n=1 Tax=Streptomyces rubiginosohelvolus TaxID=67362 RepID=UPI0037138CC2